MDYIQFAETLEDICLELGDVELLKFEHNDDLAVIKPSSGFYDYSYPSEYAYVVGFNDDGSFSCKVAKDGFFVENSDIKNFYENKNFSKEELICFINEFPKLFNDRFISTLITADNLKSLVETNNLTLDGINRTYYSSYDESYDYSQEKNINSIDIAYFTDKDNTHYRVELYTTFGMCPSGYTTASWGNMNVNIVDQIPKEFTYIPKGDYVLTNNIIESDEDEDEDDYDIDDYEEGYSFGLKIDNMKTIDSFLYFDDYGYDNYYPNGGANISLSDEDKANFFINGTYIVSFEEVVPLEELVFEEDENDEYFEDEL